MLRDPLGEWAVSRLHDLAKTRVLVRDAQLPATTSQWLQHFVRWWLIWCSVLELSSWQPSSAENFKLAFWIIGQRLCLEWQLSDSPRHCCRRDLPAEGTKCVIKRYRSSRVWCSVTHRVVSRFRERVQLHAFLISTLDAWCVVSLTPRPHSPHGKSSAVCAD
jgi:hypothetical protein